MQRHICTASDARADLGTSELQSTSSRTRTGSTCIASSRNSGPKFSPSPAPSTAHFTSHPVSRTPARLRARRRPRSGRRSRRKGRGTAAMETPTGTASSSSSSKRGQRRAPPPPTRRTDPSSRPRRRHSSSRHPSCSKHMGSRHRAGAEATGVASSREEGSSSSSTSNNRRLRAAGSLQDSSEWDAVGQQHNSDRHTLRPFTACLHRHLLAPSASRSTPFRPLVISAHLHHQMPGSASIPSVVLAPALVQICRSSSPSVPTSHRQTSAAVSPSPHPPVCLHNWPSTIISHPPSHAVHRCRADTVLAS